MYTEAILEFDGVSHIWKCINCGAVIDPIILQNRLAFNGPHPSPVKIVIRDKGPKKWCLPRPKKAAIRAVKEAIRCAAIASSN